MECYKKMCVIFVVSATKTRNSAMCSSLQPKVNEVDTEIHDVLAFINSRYVIDMETVEITPKSVEDSDRAG